ncbi:extradiol dioxygenase [Undibacterium sp. YM2]|uniref:VOC family protein n=1 Tax=Undibacterium sp. YM2 TaxID=2058625 RepID=UPI001331D8D3|nr:VOC family protein [Undibacterium sp. YM2]BBB67744.1 extradiol dioxygenase [Undibacterium sp. YM2]
MHKQIFVNLSVKDLPRSKAFWSSLGYSFEPKFTNDQAACMIMGENLFVMLLVEEFFAGFTNKPISDAHERTEVLNCLSCDSREHVDSLVAKARAAGATVPKEPIDHGFMYGHGFHDVDGHGWELAYMVAEGECK